MQNKSTIVPAHIQGNYNSGRKIPSVTCHGLNTHLGIDSFGAARTASTYISQNMNLDSSMAQKSFRFANLTFKLQLWCLSVKEILLLLKKISLSSWWNDSGCSWAASFWKQWSLKERGRNMKSNFSPKTLTLLFSSRGNTMIGILFQALAGVEQL